MKLSTQRSVSAEGLLQQIRSGVQLTILDVREPGRHNVASRIAGARAIPLHRLGARVSELTALCATPLVVVSQGEQGARAAAMVLEGEGFQEVFLLEGGMARWLELGYPTVLCRPEPCARTVL